MWFIRSGGTACCLDGASVFLHQPPLSPVTMHISDLVGIVNGRGAGTVGPSDPKPVELSQRGGGN